jgi:hypothetical protein
MSATVLRAFSRRRSRMARSMSSISGTVIASL